MDIAIAPRHKRLFMEKIFYSPCGCWFWTAVVNEYGYGIVCIYYKQYLAHRVSYFIHKGSFDNHLKVLHSCDNPLCQNPDHLFLGTQADNMLDMYKKRRDRKAHGQAHYFSKVTEDQVREIRGLRGKFTAKELGERYDLNRSQISRIWNRIFWKHVI